MKKVLTYREKGGIMKRFILIGALCFVLLVPIQAWSESFTLNNITWTWGPADPTEFTVTKVFTTPQTFNLNLGASSGPTNLFFVYASDNNITSNRTFSMNVTFDFTSPSGITDPIDVAAVIQTNVSGNNNDTLSFTFSDPVYANFGNGGQFQVDVADFTLAQIHNGGGDSGYIPFTVKYVAAPTAPTGVPEPTSMLLMGLGLLGLAGARRFKN